MVSAACNEGKQCLRSPSWAFVSFASFVVNAFLAVLWFYAPVANAFDHTHVAWTTLLKKHVVLVDGGKASKLNYAAIAQDRPALKTYLDTLSKVQPTEYATWKKPEQLAFLINAYNAFTVEKILTRYPDLKSIRDFGSVFGNPWKDKFFTLLGKPMTLDGIEHETIRVPGAFDEPRIHFAVNCASIGCPMLREEAYVADRIDRQLEEQAERFLSDRSRNRWSDGNLEISKIFDWYKKDFTAGYKGITSVEQFLGKYAALLADKPDDQKAIRDGRVKVKYLDYDWALNDSKR
ncbi:MAG: DUF547 domain-containing protein [Burkholderiales bacterium]|nr:DUF547 domain-containing protein [Burkholderiales bacterium]